MVEAKHIQYFPKRSLEEITFYKSVIEVFTLSRKLNSTIKDNSSATKRCEKTNLFIQDFSELFLRLPLSIAEAEVTEDRLKQVNVHASIKGTITYIFNYWTMIKEQSSLTAEWKSGLEEKMISLRKSYIVWTRSLTCLN